MRKSKIGGRGVEGWEWNVEGKGWDLDCGVCGMCGEV